MSSEFVQRVDLQILRYAQVWEDHRLLEAALSIGHHDDVLSIGSAGDNALALLAQGPASVTAVDISPAQIAHLQLKLTAIARLDHPDFLTLLGDDPDGRRGADRLALYHALRAELPAPAQQFWDAHPAELQEGLLHCGRLERYLQGFHRALCEIHRPETLQALFAFDHPQAQGEFFRAHIATPAFCDLYRGYFGRDRVAERGRDPVQYRYVTVDPGTTGLAWLHDFCDRVLLQGNPYMIYWLRGRAHVADLIAASTLPHLSPDSYLALRPLLPRLSVVLDDVGHLLAQAEPGRFSCANLSNLFEYMSEDEAGSLFSLLNARLRPRGRFAYWNLLVPRSASRYRLAGLRSLTHEAETLHRRDRLYLYSAFHIEETGS